MNQSGEYSEKRLLVLTAIVWLMLALGSLRFGDWRVTAGVLLGGVLSFLNVYWLKVSLKSLFAKDVAGEPSPHINSALYVLRYVFIAAIIAAAVLLRLVSVAATIVGLLSFAFAILLEAIIQLYFVIVNREES